jgi:hypothetical protein
MEAFVGYHAKAVQEQLTGKRFDEGIEPNEPPRQLNVKCIREGCESEVGVSTRIYTFLARAGWLNQHKNNCFFESRIQKANGTAG